MAAVFNFLGVLVMTMVNATVAADHLQHGGFRRRLRTRRWSALCAALFAIVAWAAAAWWFGIPTSESHALIAGLSGAAIALHGGLAGINGGEWIKVLYGLVLSTLLGFAFGWVAAKADGADSAAAWTGGRPPAFSAGRRSRGGAAMAFMHGAQDGQKFMGVFHAGHLSGQRAGRTSRVFTCPSG